mmetsp:Transcript_33408/g.88677  ORF Transcript_33408/g.88677 Transcript_33408/m.88677 type:complete len:95 (+) Transcript_33408:726-1010(+)
MSESNKSLLNKNLYGERFIPDCRNLFGSQRSKRLRLDKFQALLPPSIRKFLQVIHNAHIFTIQANTNVENEEDEHKKNEHHNPKFAPAFARPCF